MRLTDNEKLQIETNMKSIIRANPSGITLEH